jgi:hypothetical protein
MTKQQSASTIVPETAVQLDELKLRESDADLQLEADAVAGRTPTGHNSSGSHAAADPSRTPHRSTAVASGEEEAAAKPGPFVFVPLKMGGSGGRTHLNSEGSARLVEEEVTVDDLKAMTGLFYDKAFQDKTLDKFIRSHDDPHGDRFAYWIHQKLSGSTLWDDERRRRSPKPVKLAGGIRHVVHDRSSAHAAAWHSPKRPHHEVGRHFKLDECRVWMRLHFWALRESGLMYQSPAFADYYVRFIGHFVSVYESAAPAFARESLRWSESPRRIEKYLSNGREMRDVLGLTLKQALAQLPEDERDDNVWPYSNKAPSTS